MKNKIYVPSAGPNEWRKFLAEPETQWRTGYSARALTSGRLHMAWVSGDRRFLES